MMKPIDFDYRLLVPGNVLAYPMGTFEEGEEKPYDFYLIKEVGENHQYFITYVRFDKDGHMVEEPAMFNRWHRISPSVGPRKFTRILPVVTSGEDVLLEDVL